jgi:hypothetical protein
VYFLYQSRKFDWAMEHSVEASILMTGPKQPPW